jgi:hypothetical protein
MTTDTALGVTKLVVHDHIPLNDIPYLVNLYTNHESTFLCTADSDRLGSSHYQIQRERVGGNAIQCVFLPQIYLYQRSLSKE